MKEQYRPSNVLRKVRSIPRLVREERLVENKSVFGPEWEPEEIDPLQFIGKLPRRMANMLIDGVLHPADWEDSIAYHGLNVAGRVVKRLATEEGGDSREENDVQGKP